MHKFRLGVFLSTIDLDGAMSLSGLFACLAPCKGIQDSLGFWIPSGGFRIPATGFRFRCQWNLDSRLQSLVGSRLLVIFSEALDSGPQKQRFPGFRTP